MSETTTMHDAADDGWQIPQITSELDRVHRTRVRLLQASLARQILAIPPDASKRSRAARIGKIRQNLGLFTHSLCEQYLCIGSYLARVTDGALHTQWISAQIDAWQSVQDALEAGESLSQFLFEP